MLLKKQIFIVLLASVMLATPFFVHARGLVPCGGYKTDGTRELPCNVEFAFIMVAKVTNWLIAAAGVFAVYELIGAGFWMIISLGNEEAITTRKNQAEQAVIGFVLVMMAFMFVNTVANFMLSRMLITQVNPECRLNLSDPLTYLTIDTNKCNGLQDKVLHTPPANY